MKMQFFFFQKIFVFTASLLVGFNAFGMSCEIVLSSDKTYSIKDNFYVGSKVSTSRKEYSATLEVSLNTEYAKGKAEYQIKVYKHGNLIFEDFLIQDEILRPNIGQLRDFAFDDNYRLVAAFRNKIFGIYTPPEYKVPESLQKAGYRSYGSHTGFYTRSETQFTKVISGGVYAFSLTSGNIEFTNLTRHLSNEAYWKDKLITQVDDLLNPWGIKDSITSEPKRIPSLSNDTVTTLTERRGEGLIPNLPGEQQRWIKDLSHFWTEQAWVVQVYGTTSDMATSYGIYGDPFAVRELHDIAVFSNSEGTFMVKIDLNNGFAQVIGEPRSR